MESKMMRPKDALVCPFCGSPDVRRLVSVRYWFCDDCRKLLWEYPDEKKKEPPSPSSEKSRWDGE
jgi:ribosomal protein L37AE/L43A